MHGTCSGAAFFVESFGRVVGQESMVHARAGHPVGGSGCSTGAVAGRHFRRRLIMPDFCENITVDVLRPHSRSGSKCGLLRAMKQTTQMAVALLDQHFQYVLHKWLLMKVAHEYRYDMF